MAETNPADPNPQHVAEAAAAAIAQATGVARHDVAVVLGSGWAQAAEAIGSTVADIALTDLPGFHTPTVAGHGGRLRSVSVGAVHEPDPPTRVLLFLGRTHLYEGRGVDAVAHGVRTAAAAGCQAVILTNGCGGLNPGWGPGTPVLISDHLNLTGRSPLHGAHFVDLTDLYSTRLRQVCLDVDPSLTTGVYAQFPGPHYETPAEVRMAAVLGADLVGMSTALEAIAARAAGLEVLGISLVTNLAAGIGGEPLNHFEVLAAGQAAGPRMAQLLADVLPKVIRP